MSLIFPTYDFLVWSGVVLSMGGVFSFLHYRIGSVLLLLVLLLVIKKTMSLDTFNLSVFLLYGFCVCFSFIC